MKISEKSLVLVLALCVVGCGNQPGKRPDAKTASTASTQSRAPDLSSYVSIELYVHGGDKTAPPEYLRAQPSAGQAQFDVLRVDCTLVGRLNVQPEECHDDQGTGCERRFAINGRLQVFGATLSCFVPVRNVVNVGYGAQTLSGLYQSQYGRAYTLQMFPR